jgi:purine-binding chemotaxis protein CheW
MSDSSPRVGRDQRRLVFQVGEQCHEIDASLVLEVIRVPHITRVPHGPEALAGIANLRGRPVPVLSMGRLLSGARGATQSSEKIIVYDHGGVVGLLVDDVLRLSLDATATPFQGLNGLLDAAFKVGRRVPVERSTQVDNRKEEKNAVKRMALLSFRLAGQLYGLPLDHVREVGAYSDDITLMPNAPTAVIGLAKLRESVLPLISLASLLGLDTEKVASDGSSMIVVEHEGDLIGLAVDGMDIIHRLPEHAIDAVPAVLQRGRGDAQIEAIGRIADGGLLISILSPEKLFGHQAVTQAISQNTGAKPMETTPEREDKFEKFLIFQLGDESYGLPIGSVDEVVRVPDKVTRMPGAPAFVMGVINLRGKAVPLIDQRTRFDTPVSAQTAKARAIIVTLGALQAGFVVDGVSEVKAISSTALSEAPEFSSDQTEVFDRIAHIEADGRMLLLIDPQELLTRAERDIVAAIAHETMAVTGL